MLALCGCTRLHRPSWVHFNTGIGELGGTTLLGRIAGGVLGGFGMIVVVTVFCDPLAAALTRKIVRD